jgi:hypothetical protein
LGKTGTYKVKRGTVDRNAYSAGIIAGEKQGIYNGVTGRTNNQLSIGAYT